MLRLYGLLGNLRSMASKSRYRVEGATRCVDIRLRSRRQLFDNRDPAPFRERDLDPAAVEVLLVAAAEIGQPHPMKIVFHFTDPEDATIDDAMMRDAFRAHFEHELDLAERRLSENFRLGRRLAMIGLAVLGLFLSLAELTGRLPVGVLRSVLREGLTITGWVAMWRPAEVLLYDWLPLVDSRRNVRRVLAAALEIRSAAGGEPATSSLAPVR